MKGGIWNEIERMHDEMDKLFNYMYRSPVRALAGPETAMKDRDFRTPLCDMEWKGNDLVASFELPGVEKDDINLNIGDGYLELSVDKKDETKNKTEEGESYYFARNSFYRQVPLPENVDTENAQAEFRNGLLQVKFPSKEVEHKDTKKIDIK